MIGNANEIYSKTLKKALFHFKLEATATNLHEDIFIKN